MAFLAILKQPKSHGCDYTIGCGIRVVELKSDGIKEAENELEEYLLKQGFTEDSEYYLDTIDVHHYDPNQAFSFDLARFYDVLEFEKTLEAESNDEDFERAEYERLKAKFENGRTTT